MLEDAFIANLAKHFTMAQRNLGYGSPGFSSVTKDRDFGVGGLLRRQTSKLGERCRSFLDPKSNARRNDPLHSQGIPYEMQNESSHNAKPTLLC